jgi:hypothetical protein
MVGTSERLAEKMVTAVEEKMSPSSIEKIILSGEGRVNYRVDLLYDQVMHGPKEDKKRKGDKAKIVVPVKEEVESMSSSSSSISSASSTTGTLVDEEYDEEKNVFYEPNEIALAVEDETKEIEEEKIITNRDKLAKADAIIIAAHSQGVPVTVLLIARLVQEGVIDTEKTRVCVIGMAVCDLSYYIGNYSRSVSQSEIKRRRKIH